LFLSKGKANSGDISAPATSLQDLLQNPVYLSCIKSSVSLKTEGIL